MAVDPLLPCRSGVCPACGGKRVECVEKKQPLDGEEILNFPQLFEKFVRTFAKKVVVECNCGDCGHRWRCEKLPFASY